MVPIQPEPSYLKETGPVKDNARITHKRGSCASGGVQGDYNTPLHVGALFVILGTSTLACAFPILATNFPRLRIPPSFLFVVSHFGTGVLVATAFVHLLPEAFTSLGDPCLSAFWTSDYTAMPGAIALGGIFLITVIEMVFSPARHTCRGGLAPQVHENGAHGSERTVQGQEVHSTARVSPGLQECPHLRDLGPVLGRSSSMSRSLARVRGEDGDAVSELSPDGVREEPTNKEKLEPVPVDTERNDSVALSPEQKRKTEVMQVFLLEMGILFHSVFIGMSLSVTVGSKFVVLLIAITFHREFFLGRSCSSADPWQRLLKDSPWAPELLR